MTPFFLRNSLSPHNPAATRLVIATLLAAGLLLLWDVGPGDLWLARAMGGEASFPLRHGWWTETVLHEGVRRVLGPLALALILAIARGWGAFARLPTVRRVQLIVVPLVASGVVALLKSLGLTSCPWSLAEFGGQAQYASHWLSWFGGDGGNGRCFPAGHTSIGFGFVGGWFALRPYAPRLARGWLLAALALGATLGLAQQWRGAHFLSHTLWTAWLCWVIGLLADAAVRRYAAVASPRLTTGTETQTRSSPTLSHHLITRLAALRTGFTRPRPAWLVLLAACGWMALAGNTVLWRRLAELDLLAGGAGKALGVGVLVMLWSALVALAVLVAWRAAFKPVVTLLLIVTALAAHFCDAYGVLMTPSMLVNVLQTDTQEALDLLSWPLVWRLTWLALAPSLWLWRVPVQHPPWHRLLWQQPLVMVTSVLVLLATAWAIFQPFASAMRNHKDLRYLFNPLAVLYSTASAAFNSGAQTVQPLQTIADDVSVIAEDGAKPKLLLLVVGEAARSQNFSLNGYQRPTNQPLAETGVVSFSNAWSCGTSTAESLPCMFSHLPRAEHVKSKARYENLLDVLYKAGFAVLWLENQSGCKGVCERVPSVRICTGSVCMDAAMLDGLDERLAALPPERRARGVVVVQHQMGSHGPAYSLRSPPELKRFDPECTFAALAQCSVEAIRNAYDNSLVYTSHTLAQSIDWLRSQRADYDTALLYASDHGESLGEGNLYLHGLPYAIAPREQKNIGWLVWLAADFGGDGAGAQTLRCLTARRDERVSHDQYFHSVLGLLGVATAVYQRELDLFAQCGNGNGH